MSTRSPSSPHGAREEPLREGERHEAWAIRHALFAGIFALGIALRVVTQLAYTPAFFLGDTDAYVQSARTLVPSATRPSGYALFLRVVPHWESYATVTAVQHLLGLAMGLAIYAVLLRMAVPSWAAALASLPVLLDPWQVSIEHYVLTDTLFEALMLAACLLLVFRRWVSDRAALAAGVAFGAALTVRGAGWLVPLAVVPVVLLAQGRWRPVLAVLAGLAIPVGAYALWFHQAYGSYTLAQAPVAQLYGRVAPFADCARVTLPRDERALCPPDQPGHRPTPSYYVWNAASPLHRFVPPGGTTKAAAVRDFDRRVIEQQPLAYARAVAIDSVSGFLPVRGVTPTGGGTRWAFHETFRPNHAYQDLGVDYHTRPGLTALLTSYDAFYVPGPVFGACALAALLAACGVGGARHGWLRASAALFALVTLALLVTAAAISQFSWRYQLPQFALLPPAGALGLTALLRGAPGRRSRAVYALAAAWTATTAAARKVATAGSVGFARHPTDRSRGPAASADGRDAAR